jgi:predicted nucleic acid-binding protein
MFVVDSSVLVDDLRGVSTAEVARLRSVTDLESVALAPVVLYEVLRGLVPEQVFADTRAALLGWEILSLNAEGHADAADLYRRLRRHGVTIASTVDCIIAQTCIAYGAELLTSDGDFEAIAAHSALRLCAT